MCVREREREKERERDRERCTELLLRDDPLFLHFVAVALIAGEAEALEALIRDSPEQVLLSVYVLGLLDSVGCPRGAYAGLPGAGPAICICLRPPR